MTSNLQYTLAQAYRGYLIAPFEVEGGWQAAILAGDGDRCFGSEEIFPTPVAAVEGNKPVVDKFEWDLLLVKCLEQTPGTVLSYGVSISQAGNQVIVGCANLSQAHKISLHSSEIFGDRPIAIQVAGQPFTTGR